MTILTGGTLGYLNEATYLVQGRDANLGPRGPNSPPHTPLNVFLAEVVAPGTSSRAGIVRLGATKLVRLDALEGCSGGRRLKRNLKSSYRVRLDERDAPVKVVSSSDKDVKTCLLYTSDAADE